MLELNVVNALTTVPLVNGHDIVAAFPVKREAIRLCLEYAIAWQILNPQGTKDQVMAFLRENESQLLEDLEKRRGHGWQLF